MVATLIRVLRVFGDKEPKSFKGAEEAHLYGFIGGMGLRG